MGLIVSLDFGTEKTVMAVAEVNLQNKLVLKGIKSVKTEGFENGKINDWISFKNLVSAMMDMMVGGNAVDELNIALSGSAVIASEYKVSVDVHKTVQDNDMLRLIKAAETHSSEKGDFVVDVLPIMYSVDRKQTRRPLNSQGSQLTMLYKAYLADPMYVDEICHYFETLGIADVNFYTPVQVYRELWADVFTEPFAVVDMGASHVGISLFNSGLLDFDANLPLGSSTIELDIMDAFHLEEMQTAQQLKKTEGSALRSKVKADKVIVNAPRAKSFERRDLARVIQMRMEELLEGAIYQLQQKRFDNSNAPVVFTGGGSLLKDARELFTRLSGYNVRIPETNKAQCSSVDTLKDPRCMLAIGLLLCDKPEEPHEQENGFMGKISRFFN